VISAQLDDLEANHIGLPKILCALCGETSELCDSHIIPAFVYRWFKESSATGHMRFSDEPNVRIQDGPKSRLLCKACDNNIIGGHEKEFSEKLFKPWLESPAIRNYQKYLLKFAVSVSWRVLKFCYGKNPNAQYSSEQINLINKAELQWRMFLLDKSPHPAEFEQHFFIYGNLVSTNEWNLPVNINRFARNSIMMDLVGSDRSQYTFAKFGQFFIFGHIQPHNHIWSGTKVRLNSGTFPSKKMTLPKQLWPLFVEKANLQASVTARISDTQLSKIDKAMFSNIDRVANSDSFQAALADADLFGQDVIIRKK
jgi:hypothetical protein